MNPGAVVLCGGESRRMGSPKAWLPFGPEPLLGRVVRLVGTVARPVVVVAAPGQEIPELPADVRVVRDPVGGRGPLQGLAAGLAAIPDEVELVYATSTDAPFLEPRWITRLVELIGDHDAAIPWIVEKSQTLAALYRKAAVLPAIVEMLRNDRLRMKDLIEFRRVRLVDETEMRQVDPQLSTLRNLNSPEDYRQALRDAGFGEG